MDQWLSHLEAGVLWSVVCLMCCIQHFWNQHAITAGFKLFLSFCRWIRESDSQSTLAAWTLELSRDWEAYEEVLSGKTVLSKDTKEEGKREREGERAETLTNHGRYLLSFTGVHWKCFLLPGLHGAWSNPTEGIFWPCTNWGMVMCALSKASEVWCIVSLLKPESVLVSLQYMNY